MSPLVSLTSAFISTEDDSSEADENDEDDNSLVGVCLGSVSLLGMRSKRGTFAGVRWKRSTPPFPEGGSFLSSGDVTSVVLLLLSTFASLLPTEPDFSELERDDDVGDGDNDDSDDGEGKGNDKGDEEIKSVSDDGAAVDGDEGSAKEVEDGDDGNDENDAAADDCDNDGSFLSSGDVMSVELLLLSASSSLLPTEPGLSELEREDEECDDDCEFVECNDDDECDDDQDGNKGFIPLKICSLTDSASPERSDGLDR